jgi:DNA-directed RNA polymerase specialized sigma24 family protein
VDSGGKKYLEMHRRLVAYFDRKNCLSPDQLASETLDRVTRRLEEEGAITGTAPARYCYIVAKFVFLEYLRRAERFETNLEESATSVALASPEWAPGEGDSAAETRERLLSCLEDCLQKVTPHDRELIVEYYSGARRAKIECRRGLAIRFGFTINALSIRACRIRNKLELCVRECSEKR